MARKRKLDIPLIPASQLVADETSLVAPEEEPKKSNKTSRKVIGGTNHYEGLVVPDMSEAIAVTPEKHSQTIRGKIAYSAHKLADELAARLNTRGKKDMTYIKALVWSLGVTYDKLAASSDGAVSIRIPAKLLDNVKLAISIQLERKLAQQKPPIDITPHALDAESSAPPVNTTG